MTTWRTEAARAGIAPWPYCRRTMANLDGRAVEVPDLEDRDTLAAFDRRLAVRLGADDGEAREGVQVRFYPDTMPEPCWWIYYGERGRFFSLSEVGGAIDPLLARVRAWATRPA